MEYIIIQPIGNDYSINDFISGEYADRFAEKIKYEKEWKKSLYSTVLFTKDRKVFAKGYITKIEKSENDEYPLDYHYELTPVNNIEYNKIVEYAEYKKGTDFRKYTLLDEEKSNRIFEYIYSMELKQEVYLDDIEADEKLQNSLNSIEALNPNEAPIFAKKPIEQNEKKVFPRNLGYAKFALEKTNYQCEIDKEHKSFISKFTQKQYVEAHHLIPLSKQDDFIYTLDIPVNIVSLCPNCHRFIHFASLKDKKAILQQLLKERNDTLQKCGIEITEEDLYNIYNE